MSHHRLRNADDKYITSTERKIKTKEDYIENLINDGRTKPSYI